MIIKLHLVNGDIECAETQAFKLAPVKSMRSDILKAELFANNGKRLVKVERHFKKYYVKHKYVPEPEPQVEAPSVAEQVTEEPQE